MKVIRDNKRLEEWVQAQKKMGRRIGFVPTMGALHEGHLTLIRTSKLKSDVTVCSIFVNPTQFNDAKDLEKYPRNVARDKTLLEGESVDLLYLPDVKAMYPSGTDAWEPIEFESLDEVLEGAFRPGHFQGVAQVVHRLLKLVRPDELYMGQKDFQQVAIIRRMLNLKNISVDLVVVPIVRELHGLAMSSRNERLSSIDRMRAAKLYEVLNYIKLGFEEGRALDEVLNEGRSMLDFPDFRLEYLEVCERTQLRSLTSWGKQYEMVALVACWVGEVRLIDNVLL